MVAGGISFGRHRCACQKRMSEPGHADKLVVEQELGAYLRRRCSKHADLQIDETFPKRTRVFVGLGAKRRRTAGRRRVTAATTAPARNSHEALRWRGW